MLTATLERFAYAPDGTYGRLFLPDGQILYTVEQPWNCNAVGASCIPEGTYQCAPRRYNRGGYEAIEIRAVPGRTHILFHVGNTPSDLRGCIAPGVARGWLEGAWAVTSSRKAFRVLMGQLGALEWTLVVKARQVDAKATAAPC